MKDELINAGLGVVAAFLVALFTWWITERSRDRAETKKDRAVADALLGAQSDALLLALIDLQTAATTNRILWEGPAERARSFLLALLAAAGGYARSDKDVPDWRRFCNAAGEVSQALGRDRIATKTAVSGLKVELGRLAAATVPLMRHPDARIRAATEHVMEAATTDRQDRRALDAAMREFGEAIRSVLPSWSADAEPVART